MLPSGGSAAWRSYRERCIPNRPPRAAPRRPTRSAASESASSGTAPSCQAAQALQDAAARKAAGLPLGPSQGQPGARAPRAHSSGSPTHPQRGPALPCPAPPHPGHPRAPRLHGNGRAPGSGRGDEDEPRCLSHSPHRHRGSLPCPVGVSAQGAILRRRVRGRGWPKITETPPCRPRDCGSTERPCVARRRSPSSPRPSPLPETSPASSITPAQRLLESVS